MYGYGIAIKLNNDNTSKGLKGIEYPKGEITFDIDLLLERTKFNSTERENITNECTPILWNYKVNNLADNGVIPNRTMYFGNKYHPELPLGVIDKERQFSVYNSGIYSMVQNGSKISVQIQDYKLDGIFPKKRYGYGVLTINDLYPDYIGCFSVGYFEIFVPDNEASTIEDRNYYLTIDEKNFKATSLSGSQTISQINIGNDKSTLLHYIYKPGSYSQSMFIDTLNNQLIESVHGAGDAYVSLGQEFQISTKFQMNVTNDSDIYIVQLSF